MSIVVALILLAVLFGWYAWLEAAERRRGRDKAGRGARTPGKEGELWKSE